MVSPSAYVRVLDRLFEGGVGGRGRLEGKLLQLFRESGNLRARVARDPYAALFLFCSYIFS